VSNSTFDFIEIYSTSRDLGARLPSNYKFHKLQKLNKLTMNIFSKSYSLLLLDEWTPIPELQDFLTRLSAAETERLRVIYCAQEFSEKEVLTLSALPQVFKILEKEKTSDLEIEIKKAVEFFVHLRETEDLLGRVRVQNKMLNELNDNLEQIIQQRTEHLEKSKKEIELKIREIRDLIKFIKSLSNVEAFEDLILILKQEFLKYHKVRPPILIYSLSQEAYRCIYFQGQQIIDRPMEVDKSQIVGQDPAQLREVLANTLERPISPVICVFLNHAEHSGVFVFEHSMDSLGQKAFMSLLDRRTESLTIAFDRLALKWKAHQISKQWSTAFDSLQDPIVIIDSDYNVIRSNKQFAIENERIVKKMQVDKNGKQLGFPVKDALKTQAGPSGKISVGQKIYEVHAYPIYMGNQEKFFNMIIHYADVTQATILQSRLVQSEKMSAIGLLAGNIAHELNNPLTGIKSLAQILLTEVPDKSPIYSDLLEIQAAARRSELIIKNLLEFSSLHAQVAEEISVRETISKTMLFLKTALRYHNSFIELAEGDDIIVAEPHLLQQVIFNLVNNACQAMGDEGDLHLETKILADVIEIRVRDTGPGIPKEIREAIFTPFFTTKEEGQGTGLGLSMSRSVIEKFGGSIRLSETLEKGSEFIIQLPRKKK
jgi:two-component system, NtrC family, sensor kinase